MKKLFQKHREILLYVLLGGVTTLVSIGTFILFHSLLKLDVLVANALSWFLAVGVAYITNRTWVFGSQVQGKKLWAECFAFYAGRLLTLGLEEGILLVFVKWLDFPGTPIKLVAQIAVLLGNYIISKCIIFRKK